jgi:hypothetical protein
VLRYRYLNLLAGDYDLAAGFAAPDGDPEHYDRVQRFAVLREEGGDGLKLLEWALIEPDVDLVYSTRRFGRPITAFKRALVWSLRQYNGQVYGQQTRFNHHIVLYARRREDRIAELEQQVAALEREKGRGDEA